MPVQSEPKTLQSQEIGAFLGVNLRRDPISLADEDVVKSINADFYDSPGSILTRRGRSTKGLLTGGPARALLISSNTTVYAVTPSDVFLQYEAVSAGITSSGPVSMFEYRPSNAQFSEVYIATSDRMLKVQADGTVATWGISAPATPTVSNIAGGLFGDYSVKVTYVRKEGAAIVNESNPSSASICQTLENKHLLVSLVASTDPQVTNIRVYRTTSGGSTYLYDSEYPNASITAVISKSDINLGTIVAESNGVPPNSGVAALHRNRVFTLDVSAPNRVWYSNSLSPDTFDGFNFTDVGRANDPLIGMVSTGGYLALFTADTKYRLIEQVAGADAVGGGLPFFGGSETAYIEVQAASTRGSKSYNAIVSTGFGVIFPSSDGVFVSDLSSPDQSISDAIQPIFTGDGTADYAPINQDYAHNMVGQFYKGRYYLSYTSRNSHENDMTAVYSFDTNRWYFYDFGATAFAYDEASDLFIHGTTNGRVMTLEDVDAVGDDGAVIAMAIKTAPRAGGTRFSRKLYRYAGVDADIPPGSTLSARFMADERSVHTESVGASGVTSPIALPGGSMGRSWSMELDISSTERSRIHGVHAIWYPLDAI